MKIDDPLFNDLRQRDPWAYSNYFWAANVVIGALEKYIALTDKSILDFGCGGGLITLGVCRSKAKLIVGVDISDAHRLLSKTAKRSLNLDALPDKLSFRCVEKGSRLPFDDGQFDGCYSWSVFEHLDNIPETLREIFRILKPEGIFFLQIEPLYFSPYGSHLQRLIDEPWAHLLVEEGEYLRRAHHAEDNVAKDDHDLLYRENSFAAVKKHLINEYMSLNRITVASLISYVRQCGFIVIGHGVSQTDIPIPKQLVDRYPERDLKTETIYLALKKPDRAT